MGFINIHTNNLSRSRTTNQTYQDNWVYVPGTAITGDYTKPLLFTNVAQFINECGDRGPEGSITFEYVTGLLEAGLPVIFRRIATTNQDSSAKPTLQVKKASVVVSHQDSSSGQSLDVNDFKVIEKWGGTYGNDLSVAIRAVSNSYWLDIYYKTTLLEQHKLLTTKSTDTQVDIAKALIKALQTLESNKVDIEVLNLDTNKFTLNATGSKAWKLQGGEDMQESLVAAEIPKSYEYIKDKILFRPKFITSGGYTDATPSETSPIIDAMKTLSLLRQDCRAVIDLPIATPKEEQQTIAQSISYQQLNNQQAIPSASVNAPWVYMNVGGKQKWMPPSFAYLTIVGNEISNGGEAYTPKAGVTKGLLNNVLKTEFEIGADLSEKWQEEGKANINPIMKLQNNSYILAGNSTLLVTDIGESNAFSESSSDLAIIEIKRFVYNLATELQYQYNSAESFEKFALRVSNYLDKMESEGALTDYTLTNISSDDEPRKLKIRLDVQVTPTIKDIEIFLNVSYGSIEVTGGESSVWAR